MIACDGGSDQVTLRYCTHVNFDHRMPDRIEWVRLRLDRTGRGALASDPGRSYRLVLRVRGWYGKSRSTVHRVQIR